MSGIFSLIIWGLIIWSFGKRFKNMGQPFQDGTKRTKPSSDNTVDSQTTRNVYSNIDQLPPILRNAAEELLADKNNDGRPDVLEPMVDARVSTPKMSSSPQLDPEMFKNLQRSAQQKSNRFRFLVILTAIVGFILVVMLVQQ